MAESNGLPDAHLSCPDVYIDVSVDFLVGKVTVDDPHVGVATVEVTP